MEIVLIRHGKPDSATNPIVDSVQYTQWIRRYNASAVSETSRPKMIDDRYRSYYVISSDLKRAIHSAHLYVNNPPRETNKLFREMEIPRYKIPMKFKAWNWVYISRVIWMLGVKGSFESFNQAKRRAELAAEDLINKANTEENVVLFGHGFMNRYIRKALIKKGWQLHCKSNEFWGVTQLRLLR